MMTASGRVKARCKTRRKPEDAWYKPTVCDVYAQVKVAEAMLMRVHDPELAIVKREMQILEDLLWQFTH